ncbi:DUF7002 family protein [Cohnella abietis]|uniref:Uncharacterized protein n=1 Tax=Cohnella abietis TaxID=2507935 RepID=A0A3T1D5A8_9BACL|nr:hypothetical protein [Cohnella abietis]BBI33292.1 hypothetical protein KCTCHS21_26910 [Cohnella abietis]
MKEAIIALITKANSRKLLYHFTRVRNLPAIAHFNALMSSYSLNPYFAGERRVEARKVKLHDYSITLNAHLKIVDSMIDASSTQEQFRAYLDRHVFLWPTLKYCQKMWATYMRREPDERFAILVFDAFSLLSENYSAVKLSKYDSGSNPRFPAHCTYKKGPNMFLPLHSFQIITNHTVPVKASEIKEILIEDQVSNLSKHLRSIYVDHIEDIPECWRNLAKPFIDRAPQGTYSQRNNCFDY